MNQTYEIKKTAIALRTNVVAIAAPSAPSAGNPALPKMNIQLNRMLSRLATVITTIAGGGRRNPSRK